MGLKNTYQARKRFTKVPVSKTGMWYQDGDVVVPSNQITMKGPNGESDYFNSPIMGTGMQSGQTQVMYPGREYSFPNDNSVYETKMQGGGINLTEDISSLNPNYRKSNFKNILNTADIVTDAMQMGHFIPHPIGQAVGYIGDALGAGIDIAQSGINIVEGDYKGAVTNAALGILPGVTGKQGYKRANSLMTGKGSGMYRPLQPLPHFKNNPVIQKGLMWNKTTLGANAAEIGSNLNFNNNKDTIFGGYQDNTQLAPTVRPVKPKMQIGGKTSTEQNPDKIASIDIKSKMPRVDWYESIDPRNWNLRDYSAVDDYGTAYQRAKLSGQDEFYWKGKRYNTKYAGPINEEIATYGVKGQKVNSKDYITVYQYPYLDRDYFPSHIAADQSAQIAKLSSFENSDWDKSEKFFDYVQTQMQPNTPYRTISDEESLIYNSPKINYGPSGNMRGIKDDMSLSGRKEYRVYGVDPVTFFKKSQELNREIYKSIGHNWNLVTNNCADNVCDAFGVPRDKFITTPQDAIENISKKYPTLEVTGRKTYQVGGETSTEQNPERINPVYIEKSKSFFDKAAGKYRNFMRSFLSNDVGRNLYLNYTTAKDAVGMVTNPITKTIGETIPKDFLFNRVRPVDYPESNPLLFAFDTYMRLGDKGAPPLKDAKGNYAPSEEIWRKALGYNDSFNYIEPSQYRPSKTKENDNAEYVRFKNLYDPQKIINAYVKAQKTLPSDKTSTVIPSLDPYITNRENLEASGLAFSQQDPLQNFTLDKGQDEKGKYISLYDKYDFSGPANNLIYGFRKPVEIYDRMYYEKDKRGRPVYKKEKGGLQMSYLKTKRFK
jgi:hypothetical protein